MRRSIPVDGQRLSPELASAQRLLHGDPAINLFRGALNVLASSTVERFSCRLCSRWRCFSRGPTVRKTKTGSPSRRPLLTAGSPWARFWPSIEERKSRAPVTPAPEAQLYDLGLSSQFKSLAPGLRDETGVELFYNLRIAPGCHLRPDFQILHPGLAPVATAFILGLRLKIDF